MFIDFLYTCTILVFKHQRVALISRVQLYNKGWKIVLKNNFLQQPHSMTETLWGKKAGLNIKYLSISCSKHFGIQRQFSIIKSNLKEENSSKEIEDSWLLLCLNKRQDWSLVSVNPVIFSLTLAPVLVSHNTGNYYCHWYVFHLFT